VIDWKERIQNQTNGWELVVATKAVTELRDHNICCDDISQI